MSNSKTSWYIKHGVNTLNEIILPASLRTFIHKMYDNNGLGNLIFYSKTPGIGKTSLAKIIAKEYKFCLKEFDGASTLNTKSGLEESIRAFISEAKKFNSLCVINEANSLASIKQTPLIDIMEHIVEYDASMILTTNNLKVMNEYLKGRVVNIINFDNEMYKHSDEVKPLMEARLSKILDAEQIEHSKEVITSVVNTHFPSMRDMINCIETASLSYGKLTDVSCITASIHSDIDVIALLIKNPIDAVVKELTINNNLNYNLFGLVSDVIPKYFNNEHDMFKLLQIVSDYEYRNNFTTDEDRNLYTFLLALRIALFEIRDTQNMRKAIETLTEDDKDICKFLTKLQVNISKFIEIEKNKQQVIKNKNV